MKKENRIAFRVTDQEKRRIAVLARKCGLSVSEYVKQRALGYAPQPIIPESMFLLLEKIGQLQDLAASPETSQEPQRSVSCPKKRFATRTEPRVNALRPRGGKPSWPYSMPALPYRFLLLTRKKTVKFCFTLWNNQKYFDCLQIHVLTFVYTCDILKAR